MASTTNNDTELVETWAEVIRSQVRKLRADGDRDQLLPGAVTLDEIRTYIDVYAGDDMDIIAAIIEGGDVVAAEFDPLRRN